jgi:hypothetical protein
MSSSFNLIWSAGLRSMATMWPWRIASTLSTISLSGERTGCWTRAVKARSVTGTFVLMGASSATVNSVRTGR